MTAIWYKGAIKVLCERFAGVRWALSNVIKAQYAYYMKVLWLLHDRFENAANLLKSFKRCHAIVLRMHDRFYDIISALTGYHTNALWVLHGRLEGCCARYANVMRAFLEMLHERFGSATKALWGCNANALRVLYKTFSMYYKSATRISYDIWLCFVRLY